MKKIKHTEPYSIKIIKPTYTKYEKKGSDYLE